MRRDDIIDKYFESSIGGSREDFINFIEANSEDLDEDRCTDDEIDFLAQRIAQNMYYYKRNIETAKTDFIFFVSILKKMGYLYKTKK